MSIGQEIAIASKGVALEPEAAALVIFHALFETGPRRMADADKYVALEAIKGGLIEWRRQLLAGQAGETDKYKRKWKDAQAELDECKLRLAIFEKEK